MSRGLGKSRIFRGGFIWGIGCVGVEVLDCGGFVVGVRGIRNIGLFCREGF